MPIKDYLWHQNQPIAQIDVSANPTPDTVTYIHTDQLDTPRLGTDLNQAITWRWESKAFGNTPPQNLGTTINLRFPGQYADTESGLNYNHFRYYDPNTGRYISSDPIGLAGGLNTYTYVLLNPLVFTDPSGLFLTNEEIADLPLFPQGAVDGITGFGDGAARSVTLGALDLQDVRDILDIDGNVNSCSIDFTTFKKLGLGVGFIASPGSFGKKALDAAKKQSKAAIAFALALKFAAKETTGGIAPTRVFIPGKSNPAIVRLLK